MGAAATTVRYINMQTANQRSTTTTICNGQSIVVGTIEFREWTTRGTKPHIEWVVPRSGQHAEYN